MGRMLSSESPAHGECCQVEETMAFTVHGLQLYTLHNTAYSIYVYILCSQEWRPENHYLRGHYRNQLYIRVSCAAALSVSECTILGK